MPSQNEAYRVSMYERERRHKPETRVNFAGVNFGYAGDPLLVDKTDKVLLIQTLPTKDWSGLGETSYYGPQLSVAVRLPKGCGKSRESRGRQGELVVIVFERGYSRQTRKAVYGEGRRVAAKNEALTDAQVLQLFLGARSFHASVCDELDEIKKEWQKGGKSKCSAPQ